MPAYLFCCQYESMSLDIYLREFLAFQCNLSNDPQSCGKDACVCQLYRMGFCNLAADFAVKIVLDPDMNIGENFKRALSARSVCGALRYRGNSCFQTGDYLGFCQYWQR